MRSRITCEVRDELSTTVLRVSDTLVVRVSGALDLNNTQRLYSTLCGALARQPGALVLDVRRLRVGNPLALSVFAAIARQAEVWPVVPVVLCGPSEEASGWLAATSACRKLPVRRTCGEAIREIRGIQVPRIRARFQPIADACRRARELAVEACRRWNLPDLAEPACLVITELVANVVRHARTPMEVTLTLRQPYLHIAVTDRSSTATTARDPGTREEGGRGLLLIRGLTQRWGSLPVGEGKVVWALLPAR